MATIDIILGAVLGIILALVVGWLSREAGEGPGLDTTRVGILVVVLAILGGALGTLV